MLEEARWGLTWLRQSRFAPGWRITQASFNLYTDGVSGTSDDVIIPATNIPFENILAALVSAYAARVLHDTDPALSAQLLTEATEDFVAAREARAEPPASAAPRTDPNAACWRDELAYATLAAVELYRLTGEQRYADAAPQLARALLDLQEQRFVDGIPLTGYFYEDPQRTRIVHEFHTSFEEAAPLAFQALCDTWPDHPDWITWYAGVVLHSEFMYHRGAAVCEPYRMVPSAVWRRSEIESVIEAAIAQIEHARAFMGGVFRPSAFMPSPITPAAARATALRMFDEGTHLHPDYRLRAFPLWPDHIFHGNTNIQLTVTAGLTAAMQLRNQPDAGDPGRPAAAVGVWRQPLCPKPDVWRRLRFPAAVRGRAPRHRRGGSGGHQLAAQRCALLVDGQPVYLQGAVGRAGRTVAANPGGRGYPGAGSRQRAG